MRFVYTGFLALNSLRLAIRMSLSWYREGTFHMGDLLPAFGGDREEGQSVPLASAISQVTLI